MWGGGDSQTLPDGKKMLNFMHSQAMRMQNFPIFPSSWVLVTHTSHLVKLSLPYILFDELLGIFDNSQSCLFD